MDNLLSLKNEKRRFTLYNFSYHVFYILLIGFLIFSLFYWNIDSFRYFWYSLKCCFKDFIYNFITTWLYMFDIDYYVEDRPLDLMLEYTGGDYFSLLPISWDVFVAKFKAFWGVFFNKEYFVYYFYRFLSIIAKYSRIFLYLLFLYLILVLCFSGYFEPIEDEEKIVEDIVKKNLDDNDCKNVDLIKKEEFKVVKSKSLLNYERFREKILDPISEYLFYFKEFTIGNKWYVIIASIILAFQLKIFSVLIDSVGFICYFFASWDFISIFEFLAAVIVYLTPVLIKIPLFVYVIIGYLIFDKIRINAAYQTLYHNENKNKGLIKSCGILVMFIGAPGTGKTKTVTDFTLSREEMFRTDALDIMMDVYKRFSHFPFQAFEYEITKYMEAGLFVNRKQCCLYVLKKKSRFEYNNCNEKIFGYDYERYGLYFYDGLKNEYIWDALCDYAEAFFMYVQSDPLSVSNYSVRFNHIKDDIGYFPLWTYDYFGDDVVPLLNSTYSKVLDQDMLRLGKRFIQDNPNSHVLDGCVISVAEIGKERGNQFDTMEMKKSDEKPNQKNDMFNSRLKVIRHLATVRNKCFVAMYDDDQRTGSTNADLVQLHESIITLKNTEADFETCIPFYWFLPDILKKIIVKLENLKLRFKHCRVDFTLLIHFVDIILNKVYKFYIYRNNTFNVKEVEMDISYGLNDEKQGTKTYYLMEKKIHSDRYDTSSYGKFFEHQFLKNKKGFASLEAYDNHKTDLKKLAKQNSYFVTSLAEYNGLKDYLFKNK